MPYTDNPAGSLLDEVRLYVHDTSATPDLSDNEVAFLLDEEGGNPLRAAARAAEIMSARFTKTAAEKRVGPLMIKQSTANQSKAQEYMALARALWRRAGAGSGVPYAGGISIADKVSNASDTDRVRPAFSRNMMPYPGTPAVGTSADIERVDGGST